MTPFFFDIETIPDQTPGALEDHCAAVTAPAQYKKADSIEAWLNENRNSEGEASWLKTSFDGGVGQICVIGYAIGGQAPETFQVADLGRDAERAMLSQFFSVMGAIGPRSTLVGHNIVGFDIPFLWKRAMVLGVKPPFTLPRNPKPWSELVIDTMLMWYATQRAGVSMDRICRLLGIPGKDGMTGADVWPAVRDGRIDEVAAYCRGDVERTRAMYRRMAFEVEA